MTEHDKLLDLTAELAGHFFASNHTPLHEIGPVLEGIYGSLAGLGKPTPAKEIATPIEVKAPAVPIKKSVTPDFIICLEDGKKLKMLKRHLTTAYGLTPDEYRAKWGLPADYPMVAPNYAAQRSSLAKSIGLGQKKVA